MPPLCAATCPWERREKISRFPDLRERENIHVSGALPGDSAKLNTISRKVARLEIFLCNSRIAREITSLSPPEEEACAIFVGNETLASISDLRFSNDPSFANKRYGAINRVDIKF